MIKRLQITLAIILSATALSAQSVVTGVVKDSKESPVAGATVQVKGQNLYAVTDANGQFSLTPPTQVPFSIKVSLTGYATQEIEIFELSDESLEVTLSDDNLLSEVVVTARRRSETAQEVPIPVSIVGGNTIQETGAFNVNRVKELVPSVQLYSSNPRNTGIN